jgi:hypothetical protein
MTYLEGYGLAVFPAEKHGDGVCGEVRAAYSGAFFLPLSTFRYREGISQVSGMVSPLETPAVFSARGMAGGYSKM